MSLEKIEMYLKDLSDRIDLEQENANRKSWNTFWEHPQDTGVFAPMKRKPAPAKIEWPKIFINDAFDDPYLMVLREFEIISTQLEEGSGARLNVRCNYSTAILPSLFGCEMFMMDRELNTLPTAMPFHSDDMIKKLISAGIPDIKTALGKKVFDTAAVFLDIMKKYPKIAQAVEIYHPDLQGPIDNAEVIWGSEIFYAFVDEPQLVHDFLSLITDTYIAFMKEWQKLVPPNDVYNSHWGLQMKGSVMLRNDSLMNLSPDTYVEFIRDCDQRIIDEFGCGGMHFCGRGDHYIAPMSEMRGMTCLAMSQPQCNDMEIIFRNTIDKGIRLLALPVPAVNEALARGRNLRGLVSIFDTNLLYNHK